MISTSFILNEVFLGLNSRLISSVVFRNFDRHKTKTMKNFLNLLLLAFTFQCQPKATHTTTQFQGKSEVPSSLKNTHQELLQQLHQFTLIKDGSAPFALKLEELMLHHFTEEEDFILPPLGLLPSLANGKDPEDYKEIMALSEKAKLQMDHMSAEHQLIIAYIGELKEASTEENRPAIIQFEKEVAKHAVSEEEVYFPASIMVGEYLKLKSDLKTN